MRQPAVFQQPLIRRVLLPALALILLLPLAGFSALPGVRYINVVKGQNPPQPGGKWVRYIPLPQSPKQPFEDADGNEVSLSAFRGKPVLVNYWATWCMPCVRELPSFNHLAELLGDTSEYQLVTVNISEDPQAVKIWQERRKLQHLHVLYDPHSEAYRSIKLGRKGAIPLTVLYDANGNEVARRWSEANWASRRMQKQVLKLVRASSVPVERATKQAIEPARTQ